MRDQDTSSKKKKKKKKKKAVLLAEKQHRRRNILPLRVNATFKQAGGSCVMASYAVAGSYFLEMEAFDAFFLGYCEHFGLPCGGSAREAERAYAVHFNGECCRRECRGYELVLDLHRNSEASIFVAARSRMRGTFHLVSDVDVLERKLRKKEAFLNIAYEPGGNEFHSITVFCDGHYFFARDTNRRHCYLIRSLADIGTLRDSVVYERIQK